MSEHDLGRFFDALKLERPARRRGRVANLIGLIIEATGLEAEVGEVCEVGDRPQPRRGARRGGRLPRRAHAADAAGRDAGHRARARRARHRPARSGSTVGEELLGRVIDGLGRADRRARRAAPPGQRPGHDRPAARPAASARGSASACRSACARSTRSCPAAAASASASSPAPASASRRCSGMIARSTSADVNVICLVGERGREVREFIERDLGAGLARSVVVVADLRPAGARAHQGRLHRDRDRRVLPRPGQRRDADDGLGHALRDGPARGRPRDRRAAGHARLHAERVRAAAEAARARRHEPQRLDHRPLHRARRRRRHERADRRRRALDPRRPRRAHARSSRTPATTRRSTCSRASRGWWARSRRPRCSSAGQEVRRLLAAYKRQGGPDRDRRLPGGRRPAAQTSPSPSAIRSTSSCASP